MATKKVKEFDANQIIELDPAEVQLNPANVRFGLHKFRIERLMDDILDRGQKVPVEVHALKNSDNGCRFQVQAGNYRTTAIQRLNTEKKAGLKLRAVVVPEADHTSALRDAIADNTERENMSTMDCAVAIKQLLDAKVPRVEIRKIFARPTGVKSLELKPASNAWINMVVRFLEFPDTIQKRIHDGRIGVEGAYELYKNKPENWEKIADKLEQKRLAAIEAEGKEETKFLNQEKKDLEAKAKQDKLDKEIKEAQELVDKSGESEKIANDALQAAFKARSEYEGKDKDKRKELEEAFKAADNNHKAAKEVYNKAKSALAKLTPRPAATVPEAPLPQATTKAKPTPAPKAAGKRDVANAAAEVDQEAAPVKRTATEMREAAKSIMYLSPNYPKAKVIGEALQAFFDGKIDDGQLVVVVQKATGEYKEGKTKK